MPLHDDPHAAAARAVAKMIQHLESGRLAEAATDGRRDGRSRLLAAGGAISGLYRPAKTWPSSGWRSSASSPF